MKTLNTIFLLFLLSTTVTIGQGVIVTPADNGTDLEIGTPNVGGWASLNPIVIAEDWAPFPPPGQYQYAIANNQTDATLILTAPTNWRFNDAGIGSAFETGDNITDIGIAVSEFTITVTFSTGNGGWLSPSDQIIISSILVQPIIPSIVPSLGNILRTSANPGTAIITGITNDVTNFGTLSLDLLNPFPVELTSFSAKIFVNNVNLEWATATEVNNYGFDIERSKDELIWTKLGFVEGHGNSNSLKEYHFIDNKINSAGTYYYRLKQIDNDGNYEFSKTIEVSFDSPISLQLNQNYPNPFNPSTTISFTLPQSGNVALRVFNPLGEEVVTLTDGFIEAGIYTFNFNGEGLPSGMYLYQLSTPEKSQTMKMILMK